MSGKLAVWKAPFMRICFSSLKTVSALNKKNIEKFCVIFRKLFFAGLAYTVYKCRGEGFILFSISNKTRKLNEQFNNVISKNNPISRLGPYWGIELSQKCPPPPISTF